jgi:hypothetical protein
MTCHFVYLPKKKLNMLRHTYILLRKLNIKGLINNIWFGLMNEFGLNHSPSFFVNFPN